MNADELRSMQAPIKERYREHPESAVITLRAEGDLDFRGTLGVAKDVPVGFERIRLRFDLDTDASEEQLTKLLRLTERYCVVYQTLNQAPQIDISHRVTRCGEKRRYPVSPQRIAK